MKTKKYIDLVNILHKGCHYYRLQQSSSSAKQYFANFITITNLDFKDNILLERKFKAMLPIIIKSFANTTSSKSVINNSELLTLLTSKHILSSNNMSYDNIFHIVAAENGFFGCYVVDVLKQHCEMIHLKSSLLGKNAFNYTPIEIAVEHENIEFIKCIKNNFDTPTKHDLLNMTYLNAILSSQNDLDTKLSDIFNDIRAE